MSITSILKHLWNHYFGKKRKPVDPRDLVPRVRVRDTAMNRENEHWRVLIGQEGIFLGGHTDEIGEVWDVKLDSQPIPHANIDKARFELLPPRVNG